MEYIEYPVYLDDVLVIGYLDTHSRTILVRPKEKGKFIFVMWPRHLADSRYVFRKELFFPGPNSRPQQFVIDIRKFAASGLTQWEWKLAKCNSTQLEISNSDIIFLSNDNDPKGGLSFELQSHSSEIRTIVWSCHQPFDTENGRTVQHKHVEPIMEWYRKVVDKFDPHIIWGAGDTAYSDGPADFVKYVYDNPNWHRDSNNKEWLRQSFRYMYRYHWSFKRLGEVMRNYAHIFMWDDHEIHDGWGSDSKDFSEENLAMFQIAKEVADEFVLNVGPRLRETGDSHKAYIVGHQAHFITDTRTSRNYRLFNLADTLGGEAFGTLMSERQFKDLENFCDLVAANPEAHFFILNTTVPFVHANDLLTFIATAGITGPIIDPLLLKDDRDDVRDSWLADGNRAQLVKILWILRNLQIKRPDIEIINISGDVHVGDAFTIHLVGMNKPIYQITSSAITNRQHMPDWKREIIGLSTFNIPLLFGEVAIVNRIWPDIVDPNVLCIKSAPDLMELELQVLPVDGSTNENLKLTISYSSSINPFKVAEVVVGSVVGAVNAAGAIVNEVF